MKYLLIFTLILPLNLSGQNLDQINTATENAIELIKLFKKKKDTQLIDSIDGNSDGSQTNEICSEFCISNNNKSDARIVISSKLASDSIEILTIAGGQSCYFDIPFGVYIIDVYLNNEHKIKTHFRIRNSLLESYTIPE